MAEQAKLFVGQVPRAISEAELQPLFAPYGNLIEVAVIRDRSTNTSKGCAFVIYSSRAESDAAIAALHNKHHYPGMPSPLQISYAGQGGGGGGRGGMGGAGGPSENKLFLGMLPRTSTEEELMPMFLPFGEITELAILKAPDGSSKGCGFLRYKDISSAIAAVKALDGVVKLPGSPNNLVVKFAESNKQRDQTSQMNMLGLGGLGGLGGLSSQLLSQPAYLQYAQQLQQQLAQQQLAQQQLMQQYSAAAGGAASSPYASYLSGATGSSAPQGSNSPSLGGQGAYGAAGLGGLSGLSGLTAAQLTGAGLGGLGGAASLYGFPGVNPGAGAFGGVGGGALGSNKEGPPGANLFIYHLPREYSDADLMSLFSPFGSVCSCKVITEKDTGISKGFGFVSYDSADSANIAVGQMNGFLVTGGKRLKVEVKGPRGAGGPPGMAGGYRPY